MKADYMIATNNEKLDSLLHNCKKIMKSLLTDYMSVRNNEKSVDENDE